MIGQTLHVPLYFNGDHVGDEHIIIDKVPKNISDTIRDAYAYSYRGELPRDRQILATRTKQFSVALAAQIPFLGLDTADDYYSISRNDPAQCTQLWERHNALFSRPYLLSELFQNKQVDCHVMSLGVSLTLNEHSPQVYHKQERLLDGRVKKKRHMVSAFAHEKHMVVVDPTEGPLTDETQIQNYYVMEMPQFLENFCGAIILPTSPDLSKK